MTTQRLTAEQAREKHYNNLSERILYAARLSTYLRIVIDSKTQDLLKTLGYEYVDESLRWARDSVPITAEHPILPSALEARQRFDSEKQLDALLVEIEKQCGNKTGQLFILSSWQSKGCDAYLHQNTIDALVELGYNVSSTSLYDYRVSWSL